VDSLVVVINRYRKLLLGRVLTDYVLVKIFFQLQWLRELVRSTVGVLLTIILENGVAYRDALVANVCPGVIAGGGDELANYVLTLMTKRTTKRIVRSSTFHR
jgi:hypothetical protein